MFDNSASDRLLGNLKKEYPNQTAVLGRSNGNEWDKTLGSYSSSTPEDGGVAIVSKWPIVEKVQYVFAKGCGRIIYRIKDLYTRRLRKMIVSFM